ncbi:MAG: transposase [Nitrosomonas sp.]|uniref:transposase n=1 Tax=Nitrosomonas sp. TaxID=42353 RepID=UPI0025E42519|nr:transposase [Nitrosomonas sp.]UJP02022.1 MAG: transposase [Nitrosomonas sp.]
MSYLAEMETDAALAPLQSAACTYRIALGRRAGQKVLTLKTAPTQNVQLQPDKKYCVNAHGFSLHAGVRCAMSQRKELEHLCRYITRPAIANEQLTRNAAGQVVNASDAVPHSSASVRISWARLLKRVFDIDIEHCPHCGGALKIIAAILEKAAITKILDHLGLPARAPPRASAQIFNPFEPT